MVRTRRHQLRQVAADSDAAEAVMVVARAHQTLIWERTRHMLRLRAALRDYFPAALIAYKLLGLTGADTLELLAKAPHPGAAARLSVAQISAALKRAHRHHVAGKAAAIRDALCRTRRSTTVNVDPVLTEDAVINLLCEHLAADGWKIVSRAMPNQRGTDVVATRACVRLEVEAKGTGSSKAHTARFGQPFNQAQARVHVGETLLKALAVVAAGKAQAAVAFPDGPGSLH